MRELEISNDVPQEAVDEIFDVLEQRLDEKENTNHASLMRHSRVVTVNNDDELYGLVRTLAGSTLRDWMAEAYSREDINSGDISFEPSTAIREHSL